MDVEVDIQDGSLVFSSLDGLEFDTRQLILLYKKNISQLRLDELFEKIENCLKETEHNLVKSTKLADTLSKLNTSHLCLIKAKKAAISAKLDHEVNDNDPIFSFLQTIPSIQERPLKVHQKLAYRHLVNTGASANFSVPGAGKTTVMLAAYAYFKAQGIVDSLMVIGPVNCFDSWSDDYHDVFLKKPNEMRFAGGLRDKRIASYYNDKEQDLYLFSFDTAANDREIIKSTILSGDKKIFLVIDEAHKIKNPDGYKSNAIMELADYPVKKCILTGTPIPNNPTDAFQYFDFLWGQNAILDPLDKSKISSSVASGLLDDAAKSLQEKISPFFYRVKKSDLGLLPANFNEPCVIPMNKIERTIYDLIIDRIREDRDNNIHHDSSNNTALYRLRRGRIMRLRQCISNTSLLNTAFEIPSGYSQGDFEDDNDLMSSIAEKILHYSEQEVPAKIEALKKLIKKINQNNSNAKVLIWTNFIGTMNLIKRHLEADGLNCLKIDGSVRADDNISDDFSIQQELSRREIKNKFLDVNSGHNILIANPAACSESMSLHSTCHDAIYYDLSYNGAEYMQSLDRIHRVGGSENITANYHFLEYEDTVDAVIRSNLEQKKERMLSIIEDDSFYFSDAINDIDELIMNIP